MRNLGALVITAAVSICGASALDPTLSALADSLFEHGPEQQRTEVVALDSARGYFATTVATVGAPIDTIRGAIERYGDYEELHPYVERAERMRDNVYFMVLKAGRARGWFLGEITGGPDDAGDERITFRQSSLDSLRGWCREQVNADVRVDFAYFRMRYRLRGLDDGRTRVALSAYVVPGTTVPKWLLRMTTRRVFPQFLRDIERSASPDTE